MCTLRMLVGGEAGLAHGRDRFARARARLFRGGLAARDILVVDISTVASRLLDLVEGKEKGVLLGNGKCCLQRWYAYKQSKMKKVMCGYNDDV